MFIEKVPLELFHQIINSELSNAQVRQREFELVATAHNSFADEFAIGGIREVADSEMEIPVQEKHRGFIRFLSNSAKAISRWVWTNISSNTRLMTASAQVISRVPDDFSTIQ